MTKVIKEIIIMLLICLISMLILAVVLYDYIPNRKLVAEVTNYATSEEIKTQLADDIDSEEKEVVLTYEVTSGDLSTYQITNEYVPGKSNPFAEVIQSEGSQLDKDTTNSIGNEIQTIPSDENTTETNSFVDDGGIK